MPTITAIEPQKKDINRCNIYIDGKFFCGLGLETVMLNRLKSGQNIDLCKLEEMQLESEKSVALDKSFNFISSSIKTKKQISDYLIKKGYVSSVIQYVLEKLSEYKYVDDFEYAKSYISFAGKNKGKRLIAYELKLKGVSESNILDALENIEDESESAFNVAKKYLKNKEFDVKNIQKAYKYLLSKGFDYDTAKSAVEKFKESD